MSLPVLQVWSAPRCQTGAVAISALPEQTSATITEMISGAEDSGQLVLAADVARACGIDEGRILRAVFPLRGVVEWVILRVAESDPAVTVSVTLAPIRQLLSWRGFVREQTASATITTFTPNPLTVAEFLSRYVLTNLAADNLEWLSAGTIEYTAQIESPTLSGARRGELLTLIEQLTGFEVSLRRLANDAGYAIDVLRQRNATLAPVLFQTPASAIQISRTRDLLATSTAAQPFGSDDRPMGEVDWLGGTATGGGPFWIPLTDPTGGPAPVQEDGQFVGNFLALPSGGTLPIIASRASDSAVQVASLSTYAAGQRVCLWDNTTGRPVSVIRSPSAIASNRGLVVAKVSVKGARSERTLNLNGGFTTDATGWSVVSNGAAELRRTEVPATLSFLANGARAAGTGTGTPLAVDGLAAGTRLVQGDIITQAGGTMSPTAAAVPNTSGALTLSISPGLPAAFADNDPITFVRRELGTFSTAVGTPWVAGFAVLSSADTDLIQRLTAFAQVDQVFGPPGDVGLTGPGAEDFANNLSGLFPYEGDPTRMVVRYQGFGGSAPSLSYFDCRGGVTVLSAQRLRFRYVGSFDVGSLGTHISAPIQASVWVGAAPNIPPYLFRPSGSGYFNFAGVVVGSGFDGTYNYVDADWIGVPASATLQTVTSLIVFGTTGSQFVYSLSTLWSGSWSLQWRRETRTLNFNGAQSAGATSVTFKNVANMARRDWATSDTLYVFRSQQFMTLRFTAFNFAAQTLTIDTANSTAQNFQGLWSSTEFVIRGSLFNFGSSNYEATAVIRLTGISGTTVSWIPLGDFDPSAPSNVCSPLPQSTSGTSFATNLSFSVTGSATWAATGLATVPVSVPSGTTIRAGDRAWSNWHGNSAVNYMVVAADVTGPASSVQVRGSDGYRNNWDGVSAVSTALYRVPTGSFLQVLGNTMVVAATATANGSGQANVTLTLPNTNAVPDNAALTITRPALLTSTDRATGSGLRLLFAPGTPAFSTAGAQTGSAFVTVPPGESRTIRGAATVNVLSGTIAPGSIAVALIDLTSSSVIATGTVSGTTTVTGLQTFTISCTGTITSSRSVALRVYGGSNADYMIWHYVTSAWFYVTPSVDDPLLPFFDGARARLAFQRAQAIVAQRKTAARYAVTAIDQSILRGSGEPMVPGQLVRIRSTALGLDVTPRLVRMTWSWPNGELLQVECESVAPRFTDVTVNL